MMMENEKTAQRTSQASDLHHPFAMQWMDSSYQETLLPNGPWKEQVYGLLCGNLAEKISLQLELPEQREMIFSLVGPEFLLRYFPNTIYNPQLLDKMPEEARKKLEVDTRKWLLSAIQKSAVETGCQSRSRAELSGEPNCAEMVEFIQHTRQIIQQNLNRHLYLKENEIIRKWEELEWKQNQNMVTKEADEYNHLQQEHRRLKGSLEWDDQLQSIPYTAGHDRFSGSQTQSQKLQSTSDVKGALFGSKKDPSLFYGVQSNTVGRSILAVLKRNPHRLVEVIGALHGRQLPGSLRLYVWLDILLKTERNKLKENNTEKILRERFAKHVMRGNEELRIPRASHSPINGVIEGAVVKIWNSTPAMALYVKDAMHVREAAKALNILYVYDRTYEPYLVYWLFPLQLAFQNSSGEADHVYELAMYLDLLNRNYLPKAHEIFAVAERVMSKVKIADPEFYKHLKTVAQINPTINPREFLIDIIHAERSKAEKLLASEEGSAKSIELSNQLLADPLIFLRKWLSEGFVGVLDTQAAIYIWDQLFMQQWTMMATEDVCLSLLFLLRKKFMATHDYLSLKQVFLREPCKLYTKDIQSAWVHVQCRKDLNKIPAMNRQTAGFEMPSASPVVESSPINCSNTKLLKPLGIKILEMELVFPRESFAKVPELSSLNPSHLKVSCSVFFGSVKLQSKQSASLPLIKNHVQEQNGYRKYTVTFPDENFTFHDLDLSYYDLEQEMGGYPKVVFRIQYTTEYLNLTLGWAEVRLFQPSVTPEASSNRSVTWIVMAKNYWCSLNTQPFFKDSTENSDSDHNQGLTGEGSFLRISVSGPNNGNPADLTSKARSAVSDVVADRDMFDLYIDAVTDIPDSATIIKVTGRIVTTGEVTNIPDIVALPDLNSSTRIPRFTYKIVINKDRQQLDHNAVLLLRVYTVTIDCHELVIIGNCVFDIFDHETNSVRLGLFARALHHGLSQTTDVIMGNSLNDTPKIAACRIFFKILKHTEGHMTGSPDQNLKYLLIDGQLSESETRVKSSYYKDREFPQTVMEAAVLLKQAEAKQESASIPDHEWIARRLDKAVQLPPNVQPKNLELSRIVRYRKDSGVYVQITRAYGLPEGYVVQCIAYVSSGQSVPPVADTKSRNCLVISDFDIDSLQTSPFWLEKPKIIQPDLDRNACIIVQLYGLDVEYKPAADDSNSVGKVTRKSRKKLTSLDDICLGWTVLSLFQGRFVHSGEHHLPVFRGLPTSELISSFAVKRPESVLRSSSAKMKQLGATLVVNLWDGHFLPGQWPEKLQQINMAVDGRVEVSRSTRTITEGKRISEFIWGSPSRSQLESSNSYQRQRKLFKQAVNETFQRLMLS